MGPKLKSQSPQTGQFNSYGKLDFGPMGPKLKVSIPSNGSIQFLQRQNKVIETLLKLKSQSPQTGQFNSYIGSR